MNVFSAYPLSPARQTLYQSLGHHLPWDAQEERDRQRMIDLLVCYETCFSRTHFDPGHFTASGFLLAPDRSGLLLIHHKKLNRWLQPGGHALPGEEDPMIVVRREIQEETGIVDLELITPEPFDLDIHRIPPKGGDPAHEHFDVRYLFIVTEPGKIRRCNEETNAILWFGWEQLAKTELDPGIDRVIQKIHRHW